MSVQTLLFAYPTSILHIYLTTTLFREVMCPEKTTIFVSLPCSKGWPCDTGVTINLRKLFKSELTCVLNCNTEAILEME